MKELVEEPPPNEPLPPCRLCGAGAHAISERPLRFECSKPLCGLHNVMLTDAEWRRLAAPRYDQTVVDLLRAAEHEETTLCESFDCHACRAFGEAREAWIAAGRPGLTQGDKP